MRYLTLLVAEIPMWIATMVTDSEIDMGTYPHQKIETSEQLMKRSEHQKSGRSASKFRRRHARRKL